jgi:anti-sigma regulatory factor (Ser/Thr protein kinase)
MSVGEHEMRHDLLVYDSDDGFARYVALFVEEGVESGQPVVVVTDSHLRAVLTDTLSASDAAAVTFRDRDEVYTRPEAALAAYDAALRALLRGGAEAIRVYGELPFCREPEQQIAWQRYEAIVNHVFAAQPVWVTCGYNARLLPPQIVDDAWRTHREVHSQGWCENPHYESAPDVVRSLAPAADALPGLRSLPLVEDEQAFRRLLAGELARDGVAGDRAAELLTASAEVLVNAERHGGGLRGLRAGRAEDRFVCEIADAGPGLDDPFAGYMPPRRRTDPVGLWTARQLTTRLDLLSSDSGLTVRLWI